MQRPVEREEEGKFSGPRDVRGRGGTHSPYSPKSPSPANMPIKSDGMNEYFIPYTDPKLAVLIYFILVDRMIG